MAWQNRIEVNGNNNINIQDIDNANININLHHIEENLLNIIVLSSTASRITQLPNLPQNFQVKDYYSNNIHEWKPFRKATITEYLMDNRPEGTSLCIDTTDSLKPIQDDRYLAYLNYIKYNTILIVDILALQFTENQVIANFFNDYHIGGCIVISPHNDKNIESIRQDIFKHLDIYVTNRPFSQGINTTHILHNVILIRDEVLLTNTILNIAYYNLGRKRVGSQRFKSNLNDLGI